jgi:hypothetical protein
VLGTLTGVRNNWAQKKIIDMNILRSNVRNQCMSLILRKNWPEIVKEQSLFYIVFLDHGPSLVANNPNIEPPTAS